MTERRFPRRMRADPRPGAWRVPVLLVLWTCGTILVPSAAAAQDAPLELRLDENRVEAVLGPVLTTNGTARSLESGLPIRIEVVVELWRDEILDSQEGRFEWRATVRQDPLSNRYLLEAGEGDQGDVLTPAAARTFLQDALEVPLRPERDGRYYYLGRIEIETLSASDLEELRRWLRGDVGAPVAQEDGGSLLGRGFRRLLVRALGLPVQRYQARTPIFDFPG